MKRLLILLAALSLGGGLALAQPAIDSNGVQDAASNTTDVAQGGIFVVKGRNLSSAGHVPGSVPYPTTLNGVRITFTPTAGGSGVDAFMVYTYNQGGVNQLSGILPSTVATGTYNVTVNNNGAVSAAARVNVVNRKFRIFTVNSAGSGRAIVQNYISASQLDLNRFTTGTIAGFTFSPAKAGQTLILWGTGLGPVSVPDNQAPGAQDLRSQVAITVNVGGVDIAPVYAGRSPSYPGTDQMNFVLPSNVSVGCAVPVFVKYGSQTSNATTMAIADASADACTDPQYARATLARLDQGGSLTSGSFILSSLATTITAPVIGTITTNNENISGSFSRYTADQLEDSRSAVARIGSCYVIRRVANQSGLLAGSPVAALDAGSTLTLNGPNVNNKSVPRGADNGYSADLAASNGPTIPGLPPGISIPGVGGGANSATIAAGSYTLRGTGGADVGAFSATVNVNPPLRVTSTIPDNIPRSGSLTVSWSGGGNDIVTITGVSGTTVAGSSQTNPTYDASIFICSASASAGTFTVSSSVMSQLTPTPAGGLFSGAGIGAVSVSATTNVIVGSNGTFTAPLTSGGNIDTGLFISTVGALKTVTFQ
jgi:uncharacterized protein (TIGR03437 family)